MLACLLTNGAASERRESDHSHRNYVEKGMPIHSGFSFDLSTSTREPRGMDGGKSAVRWYAEIAVHAYGSVAAHSPERNFGAAQRSRSQSTRPCDCEREHLLTRGDLERQCRVRVCAVQRRRFPVGANPTRQTLQPEAIGAVMEVTKWLKPSISVSRIGDSASVQAVTRVNAEQASKRTMRRPTRFGEG